MQVRKTVGSCQTPALAGSPAGWEERWSDPFADTALGKPRKFFQGKSRRKFKITSSTLAKW